MVKSIVHAYRPIVSYEQYKELVYNTISGCSEGVKEMSKFLSFISETKRNIVDKHAPNHN